MIEPETYKFEEIVYTVCTVKIGPKKARLALVDAHDLEDWIRRLINAEAALGKNEEKKRTNSRDDS